MCLIPVLCLIPAASQLRQVDVPNFGELLDRLLAALRSTSAATQQIAASELKSSLVQHKKERESQIVGLKLEVFNLRALLVSCLLTGNALGHLTCKAALTPECLVNEQRHLERLKLLTLNVDGFETEVGRYYDNMQSLLAYLRRNVDIESDDERNMPVVDSKASTDVPIEKRAERYISRDKPDSSRDTQVASLDDSNIVKRVSFAADCKNSNCDMWINPVGPWTGALVRVEHDVFAADLPALSGIRLDDNLRSGSPVDISTGSSVASTVDSTWTTERVLRPFSVLDNYDGSDACGTLPQQTDGKKPETTCVLVPRRSASMRECRRSISGTLRSRGVTSDNADTTSYACISGEYLTQSKSQRTCTSDVTHLIGLRLKYDRHGRRDSIPGPHTPWDTSLSKLPASPDRAISEKCGSAFDTSKRQHSMSPRASKLTNNDKEFTGKVTFMQLDGSTKSMRRPNTAYAVPSCLGNPNGMIVTQLSAGLPKVNLSLNDGYQTIMDQSPRSPQDIVAPSTRNVW